MRNHSVVRATTVFTAVLVAACAPDSPTAPAAAPGLRASVGVAAEPTYVLTAPGGALPADLAASVAAAGGTLTASLDGAGVAIATSSDPDFAARAEAIKGIASAALDTMVQWVDPSAPVEELASGAQSPAPGASVASIGDAETFWPYQWGPRAVHAPEAWNAGALGRGARVAIVDGGVYDRHVDIAPNLDVAHSASFVPGYPFNQDVGTFWHGTHVAGIVAARDNGIGTIGIAPHATIVSVKVLHGGSGLFSWVIRGIYYAATPVAEGGAGANVINLSLGALFPRQGVALAKLAVALSHATSYARQRGVTVVAAAGNAAVDFDHTANLIEVPAQSTGVIAVSATGPVNFAGGGTNFDRPASYTNYGQSVISFAAPGGDFTRYPMPFWYFDMVLAPCRGAGPSVATYCFAAGTSMASPVVAGVAALVIGQHGGSLSPAQVESVIRRSADDLGKPGNDDYYGLGRVNAGAAVQ